MKRWPGSGKMPASERWRISLEELGAYGETHSLSARAAALLQQQRASWPLLAGHYQGLGQARVRKVEFDGFSMKLQFNPGRMASTAARVDAPLLEQRRCFLCTENLPPEQRGIQVGDGFVLLGNPFPIFPEHFTIPHLHHRPQAIGATFGEMLKLTKSLSPGFSVFYNGPQCGASAPDHLHFQAGSRGLMTIETELVSLVGSYGRTLSSDDLLSVQAIDDTLRRYFVVRTASSIRARLFFDACYRVLEELSSSAEEPMMNILAWHDQTGWTLIFFLREKHRPSHYFREGEDHILVSPGTVDFGGLCITPREGDFLKIGKQELREIFAEVSLNPRAFDEVAKGIAARLAMGG